MINREKSSPSVGFIPRPALVRKTVGCPHKAKPLLRSAKSDRKTK